MTMTADASEILTIKQVASYLKVTERTIYRVAAAKQIPAFKVGGAWRFSRADIDTWIKKQSCLGVNADGSGNASTSGQTHAGRP